MEENDSEATSLLGVPLQRPTFPGDVRERLEAQLAEAEAAYDKQPDDPDAILLLGQRTGAVGRLQDAIAVFTDGIVKHPDEPRLYRYRGHRLISTRQLDLAIADFTEATRLVEGRAPEPEYPAGASHDTVPTYTLQFSIWYHLGLAQYLRGDFASAQAAYTRCTEYAPTDETIVAVTHWRYMTLRRLGDTAEATRVLAPIHPDMRITENHPYHRLTLLYTGALTPEAVLAPNSDDPDKGTGSNQALMDATVGYGVGNWYGYNGHPAEAEAMFFRILDTTPPGMARFAFGYIAAEAEISRR